MAPARLRRSDMPSTEDELAAKDILDTWTHYLALRRLYHMQFPGHLALHVGQIGAVHGNKKGKRNTQHAMSSYPS